MDIKHQGQEGGRSRQHERVRRKQAVASYLDWSWNGEEETSNREEGGGSSRQQAAGKRKEEAASSTSRSSTSVADGWSGSED